MTFFRGAWFCPYCASERWAIVRALGIFGRWRGLVDTTSADHDKKYLNISSVDFSKAKYISNNVEFVGRETAYRNFEPVQDLDKTGYEILDAFSPDQIIPFLLIDRQFIQTSSGYSPRLLEGMDHAKVKPKLSNPASSVSRAINTEAENITCLICKSINCKPSVSNSENIKTLANKS